MTDRRPLQHENEVETTLNSIVHLHVEEFSKAAEYPELAKAATDMEGLICGQAAQDTFFALHNRYPTLKKSPGKQLTPLKKMLEAGMNTPAWDKIKQGSTGNMAFSALTAAQLTKRLYDAMPPDAKQAAKEQCKYQSEADEANATAQELQKTIDMLEQALEQADGEQAEAMQEMAQKLESEMSEAQAQYEQAQGNADQAQEQYEQAMEQSAAQMHYSIEDAIEDTDKEAKNLIAFAKSFGIVGGGTGDNVSLEALKAASQVLDTKPQLSELADFLGWAKKAVLAAARESIEGSTHMAGYAPDSLDISRLHRVEFMNFIGAFGKTRQADFAARASSASVLHRERDGDGKSNKGDVYILRDESGSMMKNDHLLALGIEFAIAQVAKKESGRSVTSVPFSGRGHWHMYRYPDKPDFQGLTNHLRTRYSGGTEPYEPLEAIVNEIVEKELPADILVITDASISPPPQEILDKLAQARSQSSVKIVAVAIGVSTANLEEWADVVVPVTSLWAGRNELRTALKAIM
jgi:uncharacterized protein with von Willebrand factor type A (vWA) domain